MSDVTINVTVTQGGTIDADLESATVINTSVEEGAQLAATLVAGGKGDQGDAGTIDVGTVTTVSPATPAAVTNVGTAEAAILDFDIPQGATGATGATGAGVPNGGTTAQVLRKIDNTDQNTEWHTPAKADVGLSNVDNTSDANKPVSTAQQTALNAKQDLDADLTAIAGLDSSTSGAIASDGAGWIKKTYAQFKTALGLVKGDVGLGNVDDTSDANKPVSTATQTALNLKQDLDSDLTAIAALTPTNDDIIQRKAGAWTNRTLAQLLSDLAGVGTTFQPLDSDLTTIAGLTATTDNFMVATASAWASRTPAQARTQMGLGSLATQSGTFSGTSSGTNTGDQTSIVGITGTKAQFDTAVTDGNILYVGDVTQYTDEMAEDAVGGILTDTATIDFTYNDGANTITADVKSASITEAMQVLADNTTNDVSTTKHGYVPKATNTGKFLKDDGTWASIPGGGDMLAATYDPAGISAQVAGTTAAQTVTNKVLSDAFMGNVFDSLSATARSITLTASTDFTTDQAVDIGATTVLEIPATSTLEILAYVEQSNPESRNKILTDTFLGTGFASQITVRNLTLDENKDFTSLDTLEVGAGVSLEIPTTSSLEVVVYAPTVAGNPVGSLTMFAGATAPAGYLLCQGQAVSRTTYADLFAVIGIVYGAGDASTTFNVPDLRGRMPIGAGTGTAATATAQALGSQPTSGAGGEQTHVMTTGELVTHTHLIRTQNNGYIIDINNAYAAGATEAMKRNVATSDPIVAQNAGSSTPMNMLPPLSVVNFIIKT